MNEPNATPKQRRELLRFVRHEMSAFEWNKSAGEVYFDHGLYLLVNGMPMEVVQATLYRLYRAVADEFGE